MSLYQQQKATKPPIEDVIPDYLEGDMAELALDFAAYLRENKMKPSWVLTNQWRAVYKGRQICRVTMYQKHMLNDAKYQSSSCKKFKWIITIYLENIKKYEQTIINENLQRFVWDNVFYCVQKPLESSPPEELRNYASNYPCNIWGCTPGKNIMVCGKELTNVCRNGNRQYFWCHDPVETTVNAIKRLLELERTAREENKDKT